MFKTVNFLLLLFLFIGCESKEETTYEKYAKNSPIPWERDITSAFDKAKKEHKIVLIMAVSQGCKWCEKMKSETLANKKVLDKLKKYILVMADREIPKEREQLPPFKHVPIIFFINSKKEELDNLRGYFDKEDFLTYLNEFENE